MPYILQHAITSQIYACKLINRYELEYYGVKYWEDEEEAVRQRRSFLQERGVEDAEAWTVVPIDEAKMKMCNVKLKNDPANRLYMEAGGALSVEKNT